MPKKDAEEILRQTRVAVRHLRRSCREYDDGDADESVRIAMSLRVLLHDGTESAGGLEQTGHRSRLWIMDSAGTLTGQLSPALLSVQVSSDGTMEYLPRFHNRRIRIDRMPSISEQVELVMKGQTVPRPPGLHTRFPAWWTTPGVMGDSASEVTRRDLVLWLANREGGGHISPRSTGGYHQLARMNQLGWSGSGPWGTTEFGDPVPACVRQVAWELLAAIEHQAPELDSDPDGGPPDAAP